LTGWYDRGHTAGMKTAVSVPDPLFEAADELAERLGLSRSKLYSAALERFVQDHDDEIITAKLNEVYATESSALDPVLQSIQSRSIPKGRWK
jgi:metal-responsive CopG/Arc/MetJ family transcriptional regulator